MRDKPGDIDESLGTSQSGWPEAKDGVCDSPGATADTRRRGPAQVDTMRLRGKRMSAQDQWRAARLQHPDCAGVLQYQER